MVLEAMSARHDAVQKAHHDHEAMESETQNPTDHPTDGRGGESPITRGLADRLHKVGFQQTSESDCESISSEVSTGHRSGLRPRPKTGQKKSELTEGSE